LALKYGFTGGGPVIAFIGRLAPQKNPGLFLEVALRAQNAGLPVGFLMIGDGPLAGACDKFISAQQLRNVTRVKYCAHLNEIYPLIDAIAITSDYEGLPLAMLEAMAMGVPAIATDVGDIRLVVEQYGVGVIAREVGSVDAFYGALQEFLTGIHTLKTRARGAATRVRERFCGASVAAEYDACFEQAVRAYASPQEMACVR
jgi:glycosyltransferase involved in cell wall biosynthesis